MNGLMNYLPQTGGSFSFCAGSGLKRKEPPQWNAHSRTSKIDVSYDLLRMKKNKTESEMRIMFAMCRDGSAVHVFGNTISVSGRCGSETYVLWGNTLTGPHGFRSMNCRSIDEAFGLVCGIHGGKSW